MKDAIERLSVKLGEQNTELKTLSKKVALILPAAELEDRLAKLERRVNLRSGVMLVVAVAMAASFSFLGVTAARSTASRVQKETKARAAAACEDRNQRSLVIRDIVDRSENSQNIDASKLSPETRRILQDFAAARPPQSDPESFHSFVYARTEPRDCSKL